jgi:phosphoglycerate dehydrogenase-like enzyme
MLSRQSTPVMVPVTRLEWEKGRGVFERQAGDLMFVPVEPNEETVARVIRELGAPAVIVGVESYRSELYESLPAGGVIARFGVGVENIDIERATTQRLVVTNTPGALDASVAEYAVSLLGALARPLVDTSVALRRGAWQPQVGREISGQTLAVIGFGHIGRRVARSAGLGLGMRVIAFDRLPLPVLLSSCGLTCSQELASWYGVVKYTTDLASTLAEADLVSLHLSLNAQTRRFINRERLALMKPGAYLINTARGALVDENALYDALVSGHLGGAGLDVFVNEPYVPADPRRDLRTLPNTILTPHIASSTRAANERMASQTVENVRAILDGRWDQAVVVNHKVLA